MGLYKKKKDVPEKGQAALDFLMTYGWALLIIVLIVGALFALGIFDIGTFLGSRSSGFADVHVVGWMVGSNGAMVYQLRNNAGGEVTVYRIDAIINGQTITNDTMNIILSNGELSPRITMRNMPVLPIDSSYTIRMRIHYDLTSTGFNYLESGTITGRVSG